MVHVDVRVVPIHTDAPALADVCALDQAIVVVVDLDRLLEVQVRLCLSVIFPLLGGEVLPSDLGPLPRSLRLTNGNILDACVKPIDVGCLLGQVAQPLPLDAAGGYPARARRLLTLDGGGS